MFSSKLFLAKNIVLCPTLLDVDHLTPPIIRYKPLGKLFSNNKTFSPVGIDALVLSMVVCVPISFKLSLKIVKNREDLKSSPYRNNKIFSCKKLPIRFN